MHFEPVLRNEETIAVLAVGWNREIDGTGRIAASMRMLAAETAMALERSDLLARLEESARTDDLTGLLNRRAWEEELPREMARARRQSDPLCVAMLDLDFFKNYNDERGHQAGDRLLKQSAAAWVTELRASDTLARYGGEEFTVVLAGCNLANAKDIVERLREAMPPRSDRLRGRGLLERARVGGGARRPRRCRALRGEAHGPRPARDRRRVSARRAQISRPVTYITAMPAR